MQLQARLSSLQVTLLSLGKYAELFSAMPSDAQRRIMLGQMVTGEWDIEPSDEDLALQAANKANFFYHVAYDTGTCAIELENVAIGYADGKCRCVCTSSESILDL